MIQFTCSKQALYDAIVHVSKGVAQRSSITALEGMKCQLTPGNLELTGYDLEFGIQTNMEVTTEDSGCFVVNPRLMSESVRRFSGELIRIELDENMNLSMYCEATEFHISAVSAEEYPDLPDMNIAEALSLSQAALRSMIQQTVYATAMTDTKPILTGELFDIEEDVVHVTAIDGYRLAVRTERANIREARKFVVPKRTVTELSGMLHDDAEAMCQISASQSHILFEFDGYIVFSRLLDGEFHNYKKSIPVSYETEVIIDRGTLERCLERCALLINSKFNVPIQCKFGNGSLNVWCKTGIGEINDTIPAQINGPDVKIGFSNRFLLEAVKAADTDQIRMQLTGGNRVVKMVPMEGEHFLYLLMPIQLR